MGFRWAAAFNIEDPILSWVQSPFERAVRLIPATDWREYSGPSVEARHWLDTKPEQFKVAEADRENYKGSERQQDQLEKLRMQVSEAKNEEAKKIAEKKLNAPNNTTAAKRSGVDSAATAQTIMSTRKKSANPSITVGPHVRLELPSLWYPTGQGRLATLLDRAHGLLLDSITLQKSQLEESLR